MIKFLMNLLFGRQRDVGLRRIANEQVARNAQLLAELKQKGVDN